MSFTGSQGGYEISKYFDAVGIAILIFDYAITIEDEARWVWGRSWDLTRIVFTISRYVPFVGIGLTAYADFRSDSMPCPHDSSENVINTVGVVASEVLLLLRTIAFWQGNKYVFYGLLVYGVLLSAAGITINAISNLPISGGEIARCFMTESRNGALAYALVLAFEFTVLFLMVYKKNRDYRGSAGRKSLIYTLYSDGVFYIACISLMTVANIVVDTALPMDYIDILNTPQIALHDVLASRIIFNLRKHARTVQLDDTVIRTASIMPVSTMEYHVPAEATEIELEELQPSQPDSGGVSR